MNVAPQHATAVAAGAECWRCPMHDQHQGPVPPTIRRPTKLLVVAEAPGPIEVDEGATLIGPGGREVRQALQAAGADPHDVSSTNAMLCRPLGGDLDDFLRRCKRAGQPSPLECCLPRLQREIAAAEFVILVGGASVKATGVADSVMKVRGTPLQTEPPALATLHPAFVLRDQGRLMRPVFRFDIAKAVRLWRGGNRWREPDYGTEVRPDDLKNLLNLPMDFPIAVDTETDGKDPWTCKIRRIGIGFDDYVMIYSPLSVDGHYMYSAADRGWIEKPLAEFFAQPRPFIFHNFFGFDSIVLQQHGMPVNETNVFDSLIGHHIGPTSEFPHGLDFLASVFTDAPYWKDWARHDKEDD